MSVNRKLLFFSTVFSTVRSAVFALPTAGDELSVTVAAAFAVLIMAAAARVLRTLPPISATTVWAVGGVYRSAWLAILRLPD